MRRGNKPWQSPRPVGLTHTLFLPTILLVFLFNAFSCPADSLLLRGATVYPVSTGPIPSGKVLIVDGVIEQVGDALAEFNRPPDTREIDLSGLHLYPGMIALNTELGLVEISAVRATRDQREVGDYTPDVESWIAVNPDSELIPVARANGVAYFEPAPRGGVVAGQSGLGATHGWTPEDMTVRKPVALHVYWPERELNTTPKSRFRDESKWKSLEDQAKERERKFRELDEFFKEARAYAKAKEAAGEDSKFKTVPAWEAMLPYVRGELPLMIHADEVRQIESAVQWAATNDVKMILVGGRDAWRLADRLAEENVPVVYTHTFTLPPDDSMAYDAQFRAPSFLAARGVKVTFSTGGASLVKNIPYEAAQAVAYGMFKEDALKGITLYPAQLAGVADRLGSIEPGKTATLFAADGDILDIRSNVQRMWIAGEEVSIESRHTRLYEKYKARPRTER